MPGKPIGQMNGKWAFLTKLVLATYPLVMLWAVWVTASQFDDLAFRKYGPRFTQEDHLNHIKNYHGPIESRLDAMGLQLERLITLAEFRGVSSASQPGLQRIIPAS